MFADRAGVDIGIANYKSSSTDGKELRGNLYAAAKKPVRSVIGGQVHILKVTVFETFGEDAFAVSIELAPTLDPSIAPSFTAKQGQYLAFIYNYAKIHGQAPAESDLERWVFTARHSRHDQYPGAQRPDRTNSRSGPIHSPLCTTEVPAAIGIGFTDFCSKQRILRDHLSDRVREMPQVVRCSGRRDVKTLFSVRFRRYSDLPLKKKARRGFRGYPIATIAFYGPDDTRASKAAVAIVNAEEAEPTALQRWFAGEGDVRTDPAIASEIHQFVRDHGAKSVATTDRIIGCPHEEGIDYPEGQVCPQCPFWAHRDRWSGDIVQ